LIESIIEEIDVEISRLQQARALLAATEPSPKLGRVAKAITPAPAKKASPKRRAMSAETKEKMRQGQLKRWAAGRKSANPTKVGAGATKLRKKTAKATS
jgi:hypothetical protein